MTTPVIPASPICIDGRTIGPVEKPFIIAEMSGNHNGDIERAFCLLEEAHRAGADAVKLQTYTADTITIDHDGPEFSVEGGLWDGRRLYELYQEAHTPWDWHPAIFAKARDLGITIFSSPFDPTAVDFLEGLDAPAYKIASPELIDIPLIRYVAKTGKPMIMSTGMATLDEIGDAVDAARTGGCTELVLLHCTAAYPALPQDANLASIADLADRFGVLIGLSDHTTGTVVATTAIALGAVVIEKHFTLARADGGVDSAFSLEPSELKTLVKDAHTAHSSIGLPTHGPIESEASVLKNRRSLYVVAPVRKGEVFGPENIRSIRPAKGLPPKMLDEVYGRRATRDLSFGEPLSTDMIDGRSD
ncbi:pseudaminic acid synthase [Denitrobaculum tricleocarpae]|uniref:pseudaminic acid synthase n=1 Tax=Denitrobaculum tricleocarpae TaxID=2591009 RepID=UPI0015D16DA5|nr:pseudaminic acid synthase [Denitrobaculum tricleocarpae]